MSLRHPSASSMTDLHNLNLGLSHGRYPSTPTLSTHHTHHTPHTPHTHKSSQRPLSYCSDYGSGYSSSGFTSPIMSPTFKYAQSPPLSPASSMKLFDINSSPSQDHEDSEFERSMEYHQAPDTFPCGHVLCHCCLRKLMKTSKTLGARCPVCRLDVSTEDVSLASMGLSSSQQETTPVSLLTNFDEMVGRFNGLQHNLRRLKDESVQSRSMGMTYTNTLCHLCRQSHPTLRVIQEHNQLQVRHERPSPWASYFYRLQHGKVITTFYSKVSSATLCVPCTYTQLTQCAAILPPDLQDLPEVDPNTHQDLVLAEVGKMMAKNTAPLMALKGKNVLEVDHTVRVRERADRFTFTDTTQQIERMVRQQEDDLIQQACRQVRDTGQLYHVQETSSIEVDNDETIV